MKPVRHAANDLQLPAILALIRENFAYMEARIDPPSSMHQLDLTALAEKCSADEVWSIGDPPVACVVFKRKQDALYVGKLAVATESRGLGYARRLIELAEQRAQVMGLSYLELEVRIELVENHATFAKLGFTKTAEGHHRGYDKPTYISMRRKLV